MDIKDLAEAKYQEVLQYIEDSPVSLESSITYHTLYDECYSHVISELADEAEYRNQELKEEAFFEQD